mmetsp:Transcript_43828/g.93284  ORF Transcript_43828/g.93284 Transcript_43828/m.93284 type:complete len:155 (-) Transcript_43828:304-768(-)
MIRRRRRGRSSLRKMGKVCELFARPLATVYSLPQAVRCCACGAEYAQVTRMLGNGRLEAFCFDGVNRLCHIRGKLRKRVWIGVGDIILLGLREFQDQKADIILKYDGDEARSLKSYGELPETVQINAGTEMLEGEEFGDDNFDFEDDDDAAGMM